MNRTIAFLAAASLSNFALAQAAAPAAPQSSAATRLAEGKIDKAQLTANMESTGKLLESSSAARQIVSSKEAGATSRHQKAKEIYATAKAALDAGDLPKAASLLNETRAAFFDAVRLAAPHEVGAKGLEHEYKSQLESVNALLGAFKRISGEKGGVKDSDKTIALIEKTIASAAAMAQSGKMKDAREELNRGYLVTRAALSSARNGETLVRSLNFASKEEEYNYELDRNDTHQMLLKAFVTDEKRADSMIQGFLVKSQDLRMQAAAAASKKDFAEAVKLLELSTMDLVRAIRNAGIFIPG